MKHVVGELKRIRKGGALIGKPEQILVRDHQQRIDILLQLGKAAFGDPHAVGAFEMEWLGHHANGQDTLLAHRAGNHRRSTRSSAPPHASGDEHHMAAI